MQFSQTWRTDNGPPDTIPAGTSAAPNTPTTINVSVQVSAEHQAQAIESAKNVAATLARLADAAKANPNAQFQFPDGEKMSGFALYTTIANNKFVITDNPSKMNPSGVGASDFPNHVDYLDYSQFAPGKGWGAFGNGGMNGIMLHELGHLNQYGFSNQQDEQRWLTQENGQTHIHQDYADSSYFGDNEAYADDFGASAAEALQIDIHGYQPQYGHWQGGQAIFDGVVGG